MWHDSLVEITSLLKPVDDAELVRRWNHFSTKTVPAAEQPYHLDRIIAELNELRQGRPASTVAIFDHGCGPASTLIWLAALGYTNVYGVDMGSDFSAHNRLARLCWGRKDQPFFSYDGGQLPYPDASFDLVISQQVLEHVADSYLESYYREEGRVLRRGGRALHQVPHRLAPYDSHTRTWGVHFFPEPLRSMIMRRLGGEWPDHLHLRWPWVHFRMVRRYIGAPVNLSAERLQRLKQFSYYDGPVGLRWLLARLCGLPGIGGLISILATPAVLLETRTIRGA
jgi:SAM-dependent methyltransferase